MYRINYAEILRLCLDSTNGLVKTIQSKGGGSNNQILLVVSKLQYGAFFISLVEREPRQNEWVVVKNIAAICRPEKTAVFSNTEELRPIVSNTKDGKTYYGAFKFFPYERCTDEPSSIK